MKYFQISILLFLFIYLNLFINQTNAYKEREIVKVHLQSVIGTETSQVEHHDLSPKFAPRFKRDLSKSLLTVEPINNSGKRITILPDQLYRILFSFDNDKFKTTWITVSDGNGTFLNHIDFTFTYSNDKILDLKWHLDYNTEEVHHKKKPSDFYINYRWNEIKDKDISSGLFTLFFFGVIVCSLSLFYVILEFTNLKTSKSSSLPSYYQSSPSINNNYNNSYNNRQPTYQQSQQQQQHNLSPSYQQQQQQNIYQDENSSNFIDTSIKSPIKPQYYLSTENNNNNNNNNNNINSNNNNDNEEIPDISEMESL